MEITGISITLTNLLIALSMAVAFALAMTHDARHNNEDK